MAVTICRPEAEGVSSAGVLRFLDAIKQRGLDEHAVCLVRHGRTVLSYACAPYREDAPHMLYSLSKSFTSVAAGIAIGEGRISLDTAMLSLLNDFAPVPAPAGMEKITLRHLLTMTSGLSPLTDDLPKDGGDWARFALSFPLRCAPGASFQYNTMGSYLASLMIQRAVGEPVRNYLIPRLFRPLHIENPRWAYSPQNVTCGGTGLYLTVRDIAAFGQMLLNGGVYEGKRLVPKEYLLDAVLPHADSRMHGIGPDWAQGYGYQFWPGRFGRFRADGMHGQICLVAPDQDAVLAVTAGLNDMNAHMDILNDFLNDAFDAPPADEETRQALKSRLETLACAPPKGREALPDFVTGLYGNASGDKIRLRLLGERLSLRLIPRAGAAHEFFYAPGLYQENVDVTPKQVILTSAPIEAPADYAGAYGFAAGVLDARARYLTYSYTRFDRFEFSADGFMHTLRGVGVEEEAERYTKIKEEF